MTKTNILGGKRSGGSKGLPAAPSRAKATTSAVELLSPSTIREKGTTVVLAQPYVIGDRSIAADEVYFVDGLKPQEEGPWLGEADKIAWRDAATGYECIIMRDTRGGYLSGYVGVPSSHPLYGFEHEAVPLDLEIDVHGGLTYAAVCERGPSPERREIPDEARRICHVSRTAPRYEPTRHATDYRVQHDDAWWLGFECNHVYDLVPGHRDHRMRFLAPETGAVYRDERYVYDEVVHLAAQLRAIADGLPRPKRSGSQPPPLGLDPEQGA